MISVVADASQIALDGLIDAVFAGRTAEADNEFAKARASGASPPTIVSAAIRQVANLHKMRLTIDGGDLIEFAMKRGAPPVHFSRERYVSEALRVWTPVRLMRAMEQLATPRWRYGGTPLWRKRSRNALCCRSRQMHAKPYSKFCPSCRTVQIRTRHLELINQFSLSISDGHDHPQLVDRRSPAVTGKPRQVLACRDRLIILRGSRRIRPVPRHRYGHRDVSK